MNGHRATQAIIGAVAGIVLSLLLGVISAWWLASRVPSLQFPQTLAFVAVFVAALFLCWVRPVSGLVGGGVLLAMSVLAFLRGNFFWSGPEGTALLGAFFFGGASPFGMILGSMLILLGWLRYREQKIRHENAAPSADERRVHH